MFKPVARRKGRFWFSIASFEQLVAISDVRRESNKYEAFLQSSSISYPWVHSFLYFSRNTMCFVLFCKLDRALLFLCVGKGSKETSMMDSNNNMYVFACITDKHKCHCSPDKMDNWWLNAETLLSCTSALLQSALFFCWSSVTAFFNTLLSYHLPAVF